VLHAGGVRRVAPGLCADVSQDRHDKRPKAIPTQVVKGFVVRCVTGKLDTVQTVVYYVVPSLELDAGQCPVREEQRVVARLLNRKCVLLFCASIIA